MKSQGLVKHHLQVCLDPGGLVTGVTSLDGNIGTTQHSAHSPVHCVLLPGGCGQQGRIAVTKLIRVGIILGKLEWSHETTWDRGHNLILVLDIL